MKKIDFLVVGTQKAGTTALYNYLQEHNSISLSKRKEVHFFDQDQHFTSNTNYDIYHDYFDFSKKNVLHGEITPIYMYWDEAPKRIYEYNKDIKIIVLLRNPIERAYSQWNMNIKREHENTNFYEALLLEEERLRLVSPLQERRYSYIDRGYYVNQIKKLWHYFSKDQVLILKSEDLQNNTLITLNQIADFLSIDHFQDLQLNNYHVGNYKDSINQQSYELLQDKYFFEIKQLEKILEWNCEDWLINYTTYKIKEEKPIFIFILSWNRPIYLWVCLDSIYRHTKHPCKIVIADNNSDDPLVKKVINDFEKRGLFHAVHLCKENDPFRLKKLVEDYEEEIGEYFVLIESDIEILAPLDGKCWLEKFVTYMNQDYQLAMLGSKVYKQDFLTISQAKKIAPDLDDKQLEFLIKSKAPMRDFSETQEELVDPHNPALRLMMLRKDMYKEFGFGRDRQMYVKAKACGYKSMISTHVAHRHLSLLNIYDYYEYSGTSRDTFFNQQNKKSKKTIVVILGMHRSGTSALAGSLETHGLYLGEVQTSSPFNKKGNRENKTIFSFHEKILRNSGGSWLNPPDKIVWKDEFKQELLQIVRDYSDYEVWGFKDPRTLFMIQEWIIILGDRFDFKLIGSFRNPLDVANSLNRRNNMPLEDGLKLWKSYNEKLIDLSKSHSISLINFDVTQQQYVDNIRVLAKHLGLNVNKQQDENFYETKLVNTQSDSNDFFHNNEEYKRVYDRLIQLVFKGK